MEEALVLWRDGVDGERQRDAESDVVDGMPVGAEINNHHRGSADKYRFNTSGYQVGEMRESCYNKHIYVHFISNISVSV